jgi:hypothetical protein
LGRFCDELGDNVAERGGTVDKHREPVTRRSQSVINRVVDTRCQTCCGLAMSVALLIVAD